MGGGLIQGIPPFAQFLPQSRGWAYTTRWANTRYFTVLTYGHRFPVQYRPSTTPHHRTLFWAALVILDQLVPCCFSSALDTKKKKKSQLRIVPFGVIVVAEPGLRCGNEDSHGNENKKSQENIFSVEKKSTSILFFYEN